MKPFGKATWVIGFVALFGLLTAAASGARPGPNTTPSTAAPAAPSVPGTTAGMPPTAQVLWAVVDPNPGAPLNRGFGATGAIYQPDVTGSYEVDFIQDVSACAFNATVGTSASIGISGNAEIQVAGRAGNPFGVYVLVTDASGNGIGTIGFHLQVGC
jgi:hypothetical protein